MGISFEACILQLVLIVFFSQGRTVCTSLFCAEFVCLLSDGFDSYPFIVIPRPQLDSAILSTTDYPSSVVCHICT